MWGNPYRLLTMFLRFFSIQCSAFPRCRQMVIYGYIEYEWEGKGKELEGTYKRQQRLLLALEYQGKALMTQWQLKSLLFSTISCSAGCFFLFHPSLPFWQRFLQEMNLSLICPRRLFRCYLFAILSKKGKIHYKEYESALRSEACSSGVEGVSENNRTINPGPRNREELLSPLENSTPEART